MSIVEEMFPTEGVLLSEPDALYGLMKRVNEAERDIRTLRNRPPKSIHVRMKMYDNIASVFLEYREASSHAMGGLLREAKQERGSRPERNGKRWSDDEDLLLIERVAGGGSVQGIANILGRTPLAVSGRVSHLVGIKRITADLAAHIEGYLDGNEVSGTFVGRVRK